MHSRHAVRRGPAINGRTARERVLSRLIVDPDTGCLLWTGCTQGDGYGQVCIDYRDQVVHRVMYEWFVGPVPDGLVLDHLCRVLRCASPAHLEPVSVSENTLRGNRFRALMKVSQP